MMKVLRFRQKLFSGFNDYYRASRDKIQMSNVDDAVQGKQDAQISQKAEKLYDDWAYARNNFTKDAFVQLVLDSIHNKETFALSMFVKNDKKQNSAEECQVEYIKSKFSGLLKVIKGLPKSGKGALFFKSGSVSSTKGTTKSLDIHMSYVYSGKTLDIYGTLKHIDNKGGAQDNQFKDLILTNQEFSKNKTPNLYTITIFSGSHFKTGKVAELKKFETDTNKVTQIDDLRDCLIDIIVSWLSTNFPDSMDEQEKVKKYTT